MFMQPKECEKNIKKVHEKIFLCINDSTNIILMCYILFFNEGECVKILSCEKIQNM
jgi:hypothetical protein